jgi:hypothetical protein
LIWIAATAHFCASANSSRSNASASALTRLALANCLKRAMRRLSEFLQFRKFATAYYLMARSVKPGEMPNKGEAVVRCQTKAFVMRRLGLRFVTSIQGNEQINLPQI